MRAICAVCDNDRVVIDVDVAKGVSKQVCLECFDEFINSITYIPRASTIQDQDDQRKYGR